MTSVPSSPSGLDRPDRIRCRALVVQAAQLGHENRDEIHYTQGSKRWDGITNHKNPQRGEVPSQADCSSFCTWALWRSEEHTSELQSRPHLVCRLLLEKKKKKQQ